jgi:hypothetical protein
MPKDITHWAIATAALKNVSSKRFKGIINNNYAAFLAGAVAYDIPYYASGKFSHVLSQKADELHGVETGKVWEPIIHLIQGSAEEDKDITDILLAFVLGCISHVIIDSSYHPFIYYFTGNYYDKDLAKRNIAIINHRQFESQLDLYYLQKLNYAGPTSAKYIFSQLPGSIASEFLSLLYFRHADKKMEMTEECLHNYIKAQHLFNNTLVKCMLKLIGLVNTKMRKHSALFYPKVIAPDYYRLFESSFKYRHPSSGEFIKASLDTIYNKCIMDMEASFLKLGCCQARNDYVETICSFSAVSLETGKECASPSLMRYFFKDS